VTSKLVRLTWVAAFAIALTAVSCGGSTAIATATSITIPDLTGQNAKIAENKLTALGIADVEFASATTKYQNVFSPANWTVVSIEPAPGTTVSSTDTVVLKVTKP
jgi:beta-lactam-binding protein with PASTA domain